MKTRFAFPLVLGVALILAGCSESNFLTPDQDLSPPLTMQKAPMAPAVATNVALGAAVTLEGAPFFTDGWGGGLIVDASTVVDGVFFPRSTQWDQGPVWWDSRDDQARHITLDLGDNFVLQSLVVQTDDNDAYTLYYWDLNDAVWKVLWDVPNYDDQGWGMQTRPDPADDTARYLLPTPIATNALKYEGNMLDGDKQFAVSEIQAFGLPLLDASIDIDPNTLNLDSKGTWITCYITLPEGYDVYDVDVATVLLEGSMAVMHSDVQEGGVLMLKFDRDEVITYIEGLAITPPGDVTLTVTGDVAGYPFTGSDTIHVI